MSNEAKVWDIILVVRTLMSSFPAIGQQPTPILDLREDAPKNKYVFSFRRLSGMVALAILLIAFAGGVMLAILARSDNSAFEMGVLSPSLGFGRLEPLEFFATLLSTLLIAITLHELGHLLAGKSVGLAIVGMQIGPIALTRSSGRLKVSFQRLASMDGYALVRLDSINRMTHRLRIMVAGGPLANLLSALFAYLVLRSELTGGFIFAWTQWFLYISASLFLFNLVPFRTRSGMFTDGARLKMLFFPSAKTYRWLAVLALGIQMNSGKRLKLLNRRWLALANKLNDNSRDEFAGAFYGYLAANDSEDVPAAAANLERCLRLSSEGRNLRLQNLLFLEASVFHAWFRNSAENCLKWRIRVRNWKAFPWFLVLRADTALLWSQGEVSKAISNCEEAIAKCDTLPPVVNRERFREGWKEWIEKMQERSVGTPA